MESKFTPGIYETTTASLDGSRALDTKEEFLEFCGSLWDGTERKGQGFKVYVVGNGDLALAITGNGPRSFYNAMLFAGAPELLYVAERAAEHFKDTDAPIGVAARAALAKVRGES